MYLPSSTYRVQLHEGFTFADLKRIIPYLSALGVGAIYAAPIFKAAPGSTHGYDCTNPRRINPRIGTEAELEELSHLLQKAGIGWIQDIVPNHMAFHSENSWLMDVLENGPASAYAGFFDFAESVAENQAPLMAPFLNGSMEKAVEEQTLQLALKEDKYVLNCFDNIYPLRKETQDELKQKQQNSESSHTAINAHPDELKAIIHAQHYRPCDWRETDQRINYRRFFTVNGLICLNIHQDNVFHAYHQLTEKLLKKKIFQGLRVDHVDGLYDPSGYLESLRGLAGEDTYVVVEKILQRNEELPHYWPIQGTTGYDFLAMTNNLLTGRLPAAFNRFYNYLTKHSGTDSPNADPRLLAFQQKAHILFHHMNGELDNLCSVFIHTLLPDLQEEEKTDNASPADTITLRNTIGALLTRCPVYRLYGQAMPLPDAEVAVLKVLLSDIHKENPELAPAVMLLETALLKKPSGGNADYNRKALHFFRRCMQLSGPLMAKGVEDTLMYTYNRFIGHNEVGDSPGAQGLSIAGFHQQMILRQERCPFSLNATATHDTKRGEDARARLQTLARRPRDWMAAVQRWRKMNASLKTKNMPYVNDEYFLYQTLVAVYPPTGATTTGLELRLQEYMQKALREGKQHSDWARPDEAYEQAMSRFITGLLDPAHDFLHDFGKFLKETEIGAMINGLGQLVLKCTCPGIPDIYQGTELWDFSLVDPDNRRPVDYALRAGWLDTAGDISPGEENISDSELEQLWHQRHNGRIKLRLMHRLLQERKRHSETFTYGRYIPLKLQGRYKDKVLAFARHYRKRWYIIAIPVHLPDLGKGKGLRFDWKDTAIMLPEHVPGSWTSVLSGSSGNVGGALLLSEACGPWPFCIVRLEQPATDRAAGVLLSVTSLPSAFGVGDLGPEARSFVRFLRRSGQQYWQLLPLNPTEHQYGHSPYNAISGLAGNPLLISPELLAEEGLLDAAVLSDHKTVTEERADYERAVRIRQQLLPQAWRRFLEGDFSSLKKSYRYFCETEAHWLDDYALYMVIRHQQGNTPWHQWPAPLRLRNQPALARLAAAHKVEIDEIKWQQFMFFRQWKALRNYCHNAGIKLFGDLPFYVSYDAADVWANPEIFRLDSSGGIAGMAGVPPDYFCSDGQLWGMPTFNWVTLQKRNYDWWITRLRKNLELYDLLRLDHFRAFAAYWEVPGGSLTARTGKWIAGPGAVFFRAVETALGSLPFVAEDLGEDMDDVYRLRDTLGLPGMKVLQFAFGDNMPASVDALHHHTPQSIAYTGTHDNNTTVGWYQEDLTDTDRQRIAAYTAARPTARQIHLILSRIAYASVARIAILPAQDLLGLESIHRMNRPGQSKNNWLWRLLPSQLDLGVEKRLQDWVYLYNR